MPKRLFVVSIIIICLTLFARSVFPQSRDVASDTWVATDALGRKLPTSAETGTPRSDRSIGMFYFLWNGRHGEEGPYDVTKILAEDPDAMQKKESPLWGKMYVPHHWGESIFGYYVGEDEGVLRKHAQMLGDAGVDVIIFDVTNQLTYPESYRALCKVFSEVRAAGNHAPQIAFLTPFWSPKKVVHELWHDLYGKGDYEDLWYRWRGKPLIMADPNLILDDVQMKKINIPVQLRDGNTLGQSFTTDQLFFSVGAAVPTWEQKDSQATLTLRKDGPDGDIVLSEKFTRIIDNQWLSLESQEGFAPGTYYLEISAPKGKIGWWQGEPHTLLPGQGFDNGKPVDNYFAIRITRGNEETAQILNFFTFRKPQPDYFVGPTGPNQWGWLEVFPQHPFYVLDESGNKVIEQMVVGTSQNAVEGKLGVLSNPRAHGRSFHDGREPDPENRDTSGRNFQEQWSRAFELDPPFLFITGWNEWIMGRFDETAPFHGAGVVSFVDQFNEEFSRDIEPIPFGHGDNYYYQLIANIRKYKGTRPIPPVKSQPIKVDGQFEDWKNISPEFRDTTDDPVNRDERGWGQETRYVNKTGRNDIIVSKVGFDEKNLYFYVKTQAPLIAVGEENWMMLFLNSDQDYETGWLGYDFVVNRKPISLPNGKLASLASAVIEKNDSGEYKWDSPIEIPIRAAGNELELAIPLTVFGGKRPKTIDFKWADNIQQTGDWIDLTINGDVAPNDRFNYRAILEP